MTVTWICAECHAPQTILLASTKRFATNCGARFCPSCGAARPALAPAFVPEYVTDWPALHRASVQYAREGRERAMTSDPLPGNGRTVRQAMGSFHRFKSDPTTVVFHSPLGE